MMSYLYILTEDENDDIFYEGSLETLTGKSFHILPYRLRKGSGIGAVRSSSRLLVQDIARTGHVD